LHGVTERNTPIQGSLPLTTGAIVAISIQEVAEVTRRQMIGLLMVFSPALNARNEKYTQQQCDAIEKQMKSIQSRLRQGYTAKQGRKYKSRMRELQLKRFRHCR
jgi:hypothetical protein